jgi:hypothetical protein
MTMPSLRTLACGALLAAAVAFAAPAPAQDIGSTIALPDAPFVLPVLSSYVFPADPRSGDVLTQRANNNRDSATYVPGLNSNTVRGFRRIGLMPTSGSDFAQGQRDTDAAALCRVGAGPRRTAAGGVVRIHEKLRLRLFGQNSLQSFVEHLAWRAV